MSPIDDIRWPYQPGGPVHREQAAEPDSAEGSPLEGLTAAQTALVKAELLRMHDVEVARARRRVNRHQVRPRARAGMVWQEQVLGTLGPLLVDLVWWDDYPTISGLLQLPDRRSRHDPDGVPVVDVDVDLRDQPASDAGDDGDVTVVGRYQGEVRRFRRLRRGLA